MLLQVIPKNAETNVNANGQPSQNKMLSSVFFTLKIINFYSVESRQEDK